MVRHSLNYVPWKQRKEVAVDLRLDEFEAEWDACYLPIGQSWRRN